MSSSTRVSNQLREQRPRPEDPSGSGDMGTSSDSGQRLATAGMLGGPVPSGRFSNTPTCHSRQKACIQFLPALNSRSFWISPEWRVSITWLDQPPRGFLLYRRHTPGQNKKASPELAAGTRTKAPCPAHAEWLLSTCHLAGGPSLPIHPTGRLTPEHLPPSGPWRALRGSPAGQPQTRASTSQAHAGSHGLPRDSQTAPRD